MQTKIVLPQRKVGDLVNLEVDVLAKYAQSSMQQLTARIEQLEVSLTLTLMIEQLEVSLTLTL